jgi:hypothetical protein
VKIELHLRLAAAFCCFLLVSSGCQPSSGSLCATKQGYVGWIAVDEGDEAQERFIASMAAFAKANGMEFEANRYPRGVPGNPRPRQFIASACNAHLYVIADNLELPADEIFNHIGVEIFDDAPLTDDSIPTLALKLKTHLRAKFKVGSSRELRDGE